MADFKGFPTDIVQEVHCPEYLPTPLDHVLPCIGVSLMAGLDPLSFEDVSDCLIADLLDSEYSELADDAGVSEGLDTRDLNYQIANLPRLSLALLGFLLALGPSSFRQQLNVDGWWRTVISSSTALPIFFLRETSFSRSKGRVRIIPLILDRRF